MNKQYERVNYKPLLHKKGKQWIVLGLSTMALTGLGLYANIGVNADSVNTKQYVQSNKPTINTKSATSNISKQASVLHNHIVNNNILYQHNPSVTSEINSNKADIRAKNSVIQSNNYSVSVNNSSVASSDVKYMSKVQLSKVQKVNKQVFNNNQNDNKLPNYFSNLGNPIKHGTDLGLNYNVYKNNSDGQNDIVEITGGTPVTNLGSFSLNEDIQNAKTIKFDSDVNTSDVSSMDGMFSNVPLQTIIIQSPKTKFTNTAGLPFLCIRNLIIKILMVIHIHYLSPMILVKVLLVHSLLIKIYLIIIQIINILFQISSI